MSREPLGNPSYLEAFVAGSNVRDKWDAARHLMAAKQMQTAASHARFREAFRELGDISIRASGIDQLLAIALIVRISDLVKGALKKEAAEILAEALRKTIAGLWTINEAKNAPPESKPSEIRENIALALAHASGDWLIPYLVEGIAREEKSSRCRTELLRQLAVREPHFTVWVERLSDFRWDAILQVGREGAGRLRDLALPLGTVLRETRSGISVDQKTGPALAGLMHALVHFSPRGPRPTKLAEAASSIIELIDEVLATDFTLIADSEVYSPLGTICRWWQPSAYPQDVADRLASLVRKLTSAITLRARLGQRSEDLSLRLRQALGASDSASNVLRQIAERESGLAPEIDDWLRGRERTTSITAGAISSLLAQTGSSAVVQTVAGLLLDCIESGVLSGAATVRPSHGLTRICGRVHSLASELKLKTAGAVGDIAEFNPIAHRTLEGNIPSNPMIRILRPMVVRQRDDGSQDIIERAIVSE